MQTVFSAVYNLGYPERIGLRRLHPLEEFGCGLFVCAIKREDHEIR